MTSLKAGADRILLGLVLAASGFGLPAAQAAGLRIGSVESIAPTETSQPRVAAGGGIAGRRELRFDAFGRRFELQLEATPGLSLGTTPAGVEALQGQIAGFSGSWVRLTRVAGRWTGIIYDGVEYFGVETAGATAGFNAQARRLPAQMQIVYRLRDAHIEDASFAGDLVPIGATLEDAMGAVSAELPPAMAAAVLPTRRLDVGVVLDADQIARDGGAATANALARMNIVDGIFANQVGVRISVASTTVLTPGDQFSDSTVPSTLLEALKDYRVGSATQQGAGLTHLFTARELDGQTVGIAYLKSLCSASFAASLSEARNVPSTEGLIAAHEIGHVFGAPHDAEAGSVCETAPSGFLMAAQLNGSQTLSDCSLTQINAQLSAASCLAPVDAADASLGVPQSADIAVGQASTLAFTVRSNGNAAVLGVRLEVQLPAGIEAAGAGATGGGTCTILPGRIECVLGDLAPGATRDVEISVVAAAPGNTQAALRVTAQNDSLADNDTATLGLVASPGADLAVSVTLDPASVLQGATTTARIVVRNFGLTATTDAVLTVTPDSGLLPQQGTGTGISCATASGAVTCTPASLAPGATAELLLPLQAAATATGAQRLFLRVRSAALTDPQPGNNDATAMATVTAPPPPPPPTPPASSGGGGGALDPVVLLALALVAAVLGARGARRRAAGLLAAGALLLSPGSLQTLRAAELPVWELGLGAGAIAFSDYRGADSSHVYPLPVPYVVYRGKLLQADRDGVHSMLFDQPRASLHLSLNATTPVDSDDNAARSGMPDLKPAAEVGPSLDLHLWRSSGDSLRLDLRLPARASFTLESDPRFVGWLLSPRINLDVRDPLGLRGWNLGILAGPLFADRRYHDYFYSVDAGFATAQRPAYAASGGYSGSQLLLSTSRRFARAWFGAFVRYDRLEGAAFVDSPLVRQTSAWSAGFGFAKIFAQAASTVTVDD